jgi:methyltransferase (TIGR00027 family)
MSDRPGSDESDLRSVARTAWGVARIRARESRRDDPFAALFVDVAGDPGDPGGQSDPRRIALAFQVVIRTRFYDEQLLAATAAECRQVVLLASGLDARAFRLSWPPDVALYELDQPGVVQRKDEVLAAAGAVPRCRRTTVGADLREDWAERLVGAGFDPQQPTAWLAEGLLVYLDSAAATTLLETVSRLSAVGSRVFFERSNPDAAAPDDLKSLWRGRLRTDPTHWLQMQGWLDEVHSLGAVAASYGRPMSRQSQSGFVTATRQAASG